MKSHIYSLLALFIVIADVFAKDVRKLCTNTLGSRSCGQCIKQHPDCAWCLDPHLVGPSRCDLKSEFQGKCAPSLIYSPTTEVRIVPQNNLPLGSKQADGVTIVQLEPQQVVLRMKPGDIMEVPFKYLHRPQQSSQRDFVIQTSEFRSLGVGIDFSILCGGKRVQGRQCPNVAIGDQIEFFAKVSLNECKSGGDIAVSIGAYGYQTVSAMYITPSCGCECEKVQNQEKLSPLCYGAGDLICGVCECQPGKGGNHCECDLKQHGALSAQELENRCRKTPKDLVCSGNGQCKCGSCVCNVEHVRGDYCECENMSCPTSNDRMCAGQGECKCGKCHCEEGYTGDDCSCTLDTSSCLEGGKICSGQGSCECGKCVCYEGFTGLTCGVVAENEALDDEMPESSDGEMDGSSKDDVSKVGYDQFQEENLDEVTENKAKEGEEYAEATEGYEMDGQEGMKAGEILPSVDDDTGSTSAELTETRAEAGDSGNDGDITHEGQTAGCLRIEIHSFILLISLMMLFWP
ncbi:EGF-like domain containing protein [Brugia malayi]|uniref:EGF-like domain containing protein n=1 Tax=Brugia malayi TaxID=6279 RepID=A0A4E9EYU9_BRUMA|nr:EGF-like domain containing protein [Brugia malayi]VIO89475.1 EGF-like domain containing protein [Brugia malayi]